MSLYLYASMPLCLHACMPLCLFASTPSMPVRLYAAVALCLCASLPPLPLMYIYPPLARRGAPVVCLAEGILLHRKSYSYVGASCHNAREPLKSIKNGVRAKTRRILNYGAFPRFLRFASFASPLCCPFSLTFLFFQFLFCLRPLALHHN